MGSTKLTVAPSSTATRQDVSKLDVEGDDNPALIKQGEPPDIKVIVEKAVQNALNVENMKKHLLLVGAIKDEDIHQREVVSKAEPWN